MKRLEIRSPFDGPVLYIPETGSTMDEAKRYVRELEATPAHGTVVLTDYQRAGRGRMRNRSWDSAPGESILATIILHRSSMWPVSSLSIRVALAIALYLERCYELSPKIKWPNDVLVEGRKISGVLCEAGTWFVYAGLGLNCRSPQEAATETMRTSISGETGVDVRPHEELPRLLEQVAAVLELESLGEAERRLYGKGEELRLTEGHPERGNFISGVVEGIDENGALLMRRRGEEIPFPVFSGEFSHSYDIL